MKSLPEVSPSRRWRTLLLTFSGLTAGWVPLRAQVVSSLATLSERVPVGDPLTVAADGSEGPKGIATADFDGDGKPDVAAGNLDGTITVLYGTGGGKFGEPKHLRTGAEELRAVLAADLNGDNKPDLAAASPMDGKLLLFFNSGAGFGNPVALPGWLGVRNLAAGDFDGDGIRDLAAAGPGIGLRHFRGTGGGQFEIMGDLPRLSPAGAEAPRPVYTLRAIRSLDGSRDDLLLTHAESPALTILSTVTADRRSEPALNPAALPAWKTLTGTVVISEVQLNNRMTLRDADGEYHPWVELLNPTAAPVNLAGLVLQSGKKVWPLPAVTMEPGRFLTVFLSGKNRQGPELHAGFSLEEGKDVILAPEGGLALQTVPVAAHSVADVSTGLGMDVGGQVWFDIPSPGAANNAGFRSVNDLRTDEAPTVLTISPEVPAPGQPVTVRVKTSLVHSANTKLRAVWFSSNGGLSERHDLLRRTAANEYETVLPAGVYAAGTPHRVLAKYLRSDGEEFTREIHAGLDDSAFTDVTPKPGRLLPVASVPSPQVRAFEIGPVTRATGAGVLPDLVYADDVCGLLRVHAGVATAQRFRPIPSQDLQVRGAPRDVKLADTNGDGWLDATVVLRDLDLAMACRNDSGRLVPTGELPAGRSPREAVMADFNADGRPDAAVINRYSADISILLSAPGLAGLVSNDLIYSVDGDVAGLTVMDYNNDGLDDVIQVHRASGEVSVRYAQPGGTLAPAQFLAVQGSRPSAMASVDINGDNRPDTLTANLGWGDGSISTLLSQPGGGMAAGPEIAGVGPMFAISVADFDNDGHKDLVAGLFDCRVSFFKGDGAGGFTYTRSIPFAYESRVMVTADFDQDGDIDVAGAGYSGMVVVLENKGSLHNGPFVRTEYPPPAASYYGTERIGLTLLNGDLDPDLIIGSGRGVMIYMGGPGMTFQFDAVTSASTPSFSVSDVVTLDLDGNGSLEMVASCRTAACVNILTQAAAGGPFAMLAQATVPSGRYLATGDLDGDGKPDLVGTGDVLWTVLSSRPPVLAPPASGDTSRTSVSGVLINEVLSRNTGTPVTSDGGRTTDFVELYNSTAGPVSVAGWKLRVQSSQDGQPLDRSFTLPAGLTIAPRGHAVVLFGADPVVNPAYTGFTLPAEPGTLTLLTPTDAAADSVRLPEAMDGVSWSRFRDGHPSFRADGIPSPGMSNVDNGTVSPEVKLTPPSPQTMVPGMPLTFTAKGNDDAGIVGLSLMWKPVGSAGEPQRLELFDDGMHDDLAAVDGFFAGRMLAGLSAGSEVQFYLEATDLSGNTVRMPDNATLTGPGEQPVAWTFSMSTPPVLEITGVCTNNISLVRDERGGYPDYVKVRNAGAVPVPMGGVLLAKSPLSGAASAFGFPAGLTLAPGAEVTVFADGNPDEGALHAPFTFNAAGDDLALLAVTPSGARQWIQSLSVPPTSGFDQVFRKLPGSELRALVSKGMESAGSAAAFDAGGNDYPAAWIQTVAGTAYRVEGLAPVPGGGTAWQNWTGFAGDGQVRTVVHRDGVFSEIRIVPIPVPPVIRSVVALHNGTSMVVQADAPAGTVAWLYYGPSDAGPARGAWPRFVASGASNKDGTFVFTIPGTDAAGASRYYRIEVENTAGNVWSAAGAYVVAGDTQPRFNPAEVIGLTPDSAIVSMPADNLPQAQMSVVFGTEDRGGDLAQWQRSAPAAIREPSTLRIVSDLTGLLPGTRYFARFVMNAGGAVPYVSPLRVSFRTADALENMQWNLRITELMYHPTDPTPAEEAMGFIADDFEFIELRNQSSAPMDLSGVYFNGIGFDFPSSGAPVLAPGAYAVIAANPHAFARRYGSGIPLAGWTLHPFRSGKLSNAGESLSIHASDGTLIASQYYNDFRLDDGYGYSLDLAGSTYFPKTSEWLTSRITDGTPGAAPLPPPDLTLAAWTAQEFTPAQQGNPAISGPEADPDKDGRTNQMEYFVGSSPTVPDPGDLLTIGEGSWPSHIRLTFPVSVRALSGSAIMDQGNGLGGPWYGGPVLVSGYPYYSELIVSRLTPDGKQLMVTVERFRSLPSTFFRLRVTP